MKIPVVRQILFRYRFLFSAVFFLGLLGCKRYPSKEDSLVNSRYGFAPSGCGKNLPRISQEGCVISSAARRAIVSPLLPGLSRAGLLAGSHFSFAFDYARMPVDTFGMLAEIYGNGFPVSFVRPRPNTVYYLEDYFQPGVQVVSGRKIRPPLATTAFGVVLGAFSSQVVTPGNGLALPPMLAGQLLKDSSAFAALRLPANYDERDYAKLRLRMVFTGFSLEEWQQVLLAATQQTSFRVVKRFDEAMLEPLPDNSVLEAVNNNGKAAQEFNGEPAPYARRNELLAPGDLLLVFAIKAEQISSSSAGGMEPNSVTPSAVSRLPLDKLQGKVQALPKNPEKNSSQSVANLIQQSQERQALQNATTTDGALKCLSVGTLVHGGFLVEKDVVMDSLPASDGFLFRFSSFDEFLAAAKILRYHKGEAILPGVDFTERAASEKNAIGQNLCVVALRKSNANSPWPSPIDLVEKLRMSPKYSSASWTKKTIALDLPMPESFAAIKLENYQKVGLQPLDLR